MSGIYASIERLNQSTQSWECEETFIYTDVTDKEKHVLFPVGNTCEYTFDQVIPDSYYGMKTPLSEGVKTHIDHTTYREPKSHEILLLTLHDYLHIKTQKHSQNTILMLSTPFQTPILLPVRELYHFQMNEVQKERIHNNEWVQYTGGEFLLDERLKRKSIEINNLYLKAIEWNDFLFNTIEVFTRMGELSIQDELSTDEVRACIWIGR